MSTSASAEFCYPGYLAIRKGGTCTIQYTNGLEFDYPWERHSERKDVIAFAADGGTSCLIFARILENDVVDAAWSETFVNRYPSFGDIRNYAVRIR